MCQWQIITPLCGAYHSNEIHIIFTLDISIVFNQEIEFASIVNRMTNSVSFVLTTISYSKVFDFKANAIAFVTESIRIGFRFPRLNQQNAYL